MVETLQHFESVIGPATRDHPLVAIAPGGAAVAAGLFMWLGGLGFKKVLMGLAGAAGGFAVGYFVIGRGIVPAAVAAGTAAGIAILLERAFIALLATFLAASIGFAVLIGPHISTENTQVEPARQNAMADDEDMEQLEAYLADFEGRVKNAFDEVPVYKWLILALITGVVLVVGFMFRRLAAAAYFSALGTLLIAGGMGLLLLYKDSTPLSWVGERPLMYAGIAGGMVAFGTFEQLLFCRGGIVRSGRKVKSEDDDEGTDKKKDHAA